MLSILQGRTNFPLRPMVSLGTTLRRIIVLRENFVCGKHLAHYLISPMGYKPQTTTCSGYMVEWSHGAERASHDAVVSIAPSKIPYSEFSPVRLQG